MNIPTLPFDTVAKFILFAGILLVIGDAYYFFNDFDNEHDKVMQNLDKLAEVKYEYTLDSADAIAIKKRIVTANIKINDTNITDEKKTILFRELDNDSLSLFKKNTLKSKLSQEILILEKRTTQPVDFVSFIFFLMLLLGGFFLFVGGIISWDKSEQLNNASLIRKNQIESKELPCQSCGMILKYDLKPFVEAGFCCNCFDGENFTDQSLTLKIMSEKISVQMNEQEISEKLIKKHLSELANLNRWKKTLNWSKKNNQLTEQIDANE